MSVYGMRAKSFFAFGPAAPNNQGRRHHRSPRHWVGADQALHLRSDRSQRPPKAAHSARADFCSRWAGAGLRLAHRNGAADRSRPPPGNGLFAKQLGDDENHHRAGEAAAEQKVEEGITDGGERCDESEHGDKEAEVAVLRRWIRRPRDRSARPPGARYESFAAACTGVYPAMAASPAWRRRNRCKAVMIAPAPRIAACQAAS